MLTNSLRALVSITLRNREMLTSALRVFVKNPIKESFYGKKKINVLTHFFIPHKSDVKTFLKWIVNSALKALVSMTLRNRKMLTSTLRAFVNNPIKESFYGEKKILMF